jgi:hypothetical protein
MLVLHLLKFNSYGGILLQIPEALPYILVNIWPRVWEVQIHSINTEIYVNSKIFNQTIV